MTVKDNRSSRKARQQARPASQEPVQPNFAFDELLLSQGRLAIVSALLVPGRMDFVTLKQLLAMTAGNLSVHSSKLEAAGYLQIEKDFVGKTPRTTFILTAKGRLALLTHVERLSQIVHGK